MADGATSPAIPQAELGALLTANSAYRLTRGVWMASLVALVYDHLLTLNDEITYVYDGRFTFMKGVFLINRYWPLARIILDNVVLALPHPSLHFCFIWINSFAYSPIPVHFSIGVTLIMRIYAMYSCNKKLLTFLSVFLGAQIISETIVIGITTSREILQPLPPIPNFTGCIVIGSEEWQWVYWLPMLLFELTLFSLAVAKSVEVYRDRRSAGEAPNLLVLLIRDSVLYFAGVMVVLFTNLIMWAAAPHGVYEPTFTNTAFAAHSILGCRMLVNIQHAVEKPRYQDRTMGLQSSVLYAAPTGRTWPSEMPSEDSYQLQSLNPPQAASDAEAGPSNSATS